MLTGKILSFDNIKGFGYIIPIDNSDYSEPIFFHYSDIKYKGAGKFKTLKQNQTVIFEIKNNESILRASNIVEKE
ncbi:cold shock domain-containing protein [Candidatus Dependentiae bacterium]|nr:cold shock domain-containing protein [Candidatus Dependentiae bacterium]